MLKVHKLLIISILAAVLVLSILTTIMRFSGPSRLFAFIPWASASLARAESPRSCPAKLDVSLDHFPPVDTDINNLESALTAEGTYGMVFNSSEAPKTIYNYCNMPHAMKVNYPKASEEFELQYVEVVQRHHKRTPYAENMFPDEMNTWMCEDERIYYGAMTDRKGSSNTYWEVYSSPSNPLTPESFDGTCQYPQITEDGLIDTYWHGEQFKNVYLDLLGFLPMNYHSKLMAYRVTNNPITSQIAAMFIQGSWHDRGPGNMDKDIPLFIQPKQFDSLEPGYSCPTAEKLYASYGPGSNSSDWLAHLSQSADLKTRLDSITGINPTDPAWTQSWDHYFDNLSSRQCHSKPLPCHPTNTSDCITQTEADTVYRLGSYEYSYLYRDHPLSLAFSAASYGIYLGELATNIRQVTGAARLSSIPQTSTRVKYRHNFAHDGSIARLLSILQINQMVWPGMGAEIVFEVFERDFCFFLRVLWNGQILRSSHPDLGWMDMVPVETVLAYFDGLVGVEGRKVKGLCGLKERG